MVVGVALGPIRSLSSFEMFPKDLKRVMKKIFDGGVSTVSARRLVREQLRLVDGKLKIRNVEYRLDKNCYIVGFGKAVLEMGLEAEAILGKHCRGGILSVPEGSFIAGEYTKLQVLHGAKNNISDLKAMSAAKRIVELVDNLKEGDLLLTLVSGGGSSLLPLPTPGVTLEDKIAAVTLLSNAGGDITQMNAVRTALSEVKGGKLAERAYPADVLALILSDIVGDPIHLIASGPTVPFNNASPSPVDIINRYNLRDKISQSVLHILDNPTVYETSSLSKVQNVLIGNNLLALKGSKEVAMEHGFFCLVMSSTLQGLVHELAPSYAHFAALICKALSAKIDHIQFEEACQQIKHVSLNEDNCSELAEFIYNDLFPHNRGICLLFGGEPTVQVLGSGKGGRSQELALRFSIEVSTESATMDYDVALLCGGTDGIDGPTDAAGALAYRGQLLEAKNQKIDCFSYLKNNDSYEYYSKLNNGDDHIKIGHTFTNVMDIHILVIQAKEQMTD